MINTIDKTSLINVILNTDGNISAENTDFHQCQNTHQYQQQVLHQYALDQNNYSQVYRIKGRYFICIQ